PHPRSPLLPYTTLFRSRLAHAAAYAARLPQRAADNPLHRPERDVRDGLLRDLRPDEPPPHLLQCRAQPAAREALPRRLPAFVGRDRKSTRLNSSHLVIS